uniref:Uncharacterized protein n=1 Tax=Populus trichocarpa TaxID=3694 RepID=A0A3N7FFT0_POPTR
MKQTPYRQTGTDKSSPRASFNPPIIYPLKIHLCPELSLSLLVSLSRTSFFA